MSEDTPIEDAEVEEIEATLGVEIEEALRRVKKDDQDGILTAEAVVEAAKDPESPLHHQFEWDDSAAAHAHRLNQARQLIRTVVIRENHQPARRYVNVRVTLAGGAVRRGYVDRDRALADDALFEQVVEQCRRIIRQQREKLYGFERARGLVGKLDEAIEEIESTTRRERDDDAAA